MSFSEARRRPDTVARSPGAKRREALATVLRVCAERLARALRVGHVRMDVLEEREAVDGAREERCRGCVEEPGLIVRVVVEERSWFILGA